MLPWAGGTLKVPRVGRLGRLEVMVAWEFSDSTLKISRGGEDIFATRIPKPKKSQPLEKKNKKRKHHPLVSTVFRQMFLGSPDHPDIGL